MKLFLKILLPAVVLGAAALAVRSMLAHLEKPRVVQPPPVAPLVRVVTATPQKLRIDVRSQGTVEARTEVPVSVQVSGRVAFVSPRLRTGEFFAKDEVLLRIEDEDYRLRLVQQEAAVARAELQLQREKAEAAVALAAWKTLEGDKKPDDLASRRLQVLDAEKALAAAKAGLRQAQIDLARTSVSVPFAGRVRKASVDIGQLVQPGMEVARVYATDFAEVRLPIPDADAAFLDLSLGMHQQGQERKRPRVALRANFGGRECKWVGFIDRVEGEIDRRTRQLTLVAWIRDPYSKTDDPSRPPLAVGMFVEAVIEGREFDQVIALPRTALRDDGSVLVVGREQRLEARTVQVLRGERERVLLSAGVSAGERVCVTPIDSFVQGMAVSLLDDDGEIELPPPGNPGAAASGPAAKGAGR